MLINFDNTSPARNHQDKKAGIPQRNGRDAQAQGGDWYNAGLLEGVGSPEKGRIM